MQIYAKHASEWRKAKIVVASSARYKVTNSNIHSSVLTADAPKMYTLKM